MNWSNGDHSAITTNVQGELISKWRFYPFMQHQWNDSPYGSSGLKYYIRPVISGATTLCYSGSSYSINSLPSGTSIVWSTSNNITRVSSQGANPCTFKAAEGNVGNSGTITAVVSINGNSISISKNVSMGISANISGNSSVLVGQTGTWNASASCGKSPYSYSWYLRKDGTGQAAEYIGSGSSLTLQSVSAGSSNPMICQPTTSTIFYLYALGVDANGNSDASSEKKITAFGNVDLIPMYLPRSLTTKSASLSDEEQSKNEALDEIEPFVVYPNPTSNYIYIEIPSILLEEQTCKVILYNSGMREIKTFKVNERIESIDISLLTSGLYFLQLRSGKQILTTKIIKH